MFVLDYELSEKYHFEMNNFFLRIFVLKDSGIEL